MDSWRTTYKGIVPDTFLDSLSYESREQIWKRGIEENHIYIAEDENGQIVGFATGGKERTGKYEAYKGELYAIYLLEGQQGKGIGRKLFKSVVDDLKDKKLNSMLIWALEENPACRFYEALGGKKIDTAEIEIDGRKLGEIAYGWDDLSESGIMIRKGWAEMKRLKRIIGIFFLSVILLLLFVVGGSWIYHSAVMKIEVPMYFFISNGNEINISNWREILTDYISQLERGQYLFLDVGHYVHAWEPELIAEEIDDFIKCQLN